MKPLDKVVKDIKKKAIKIIAGLTNCNYNHVLSIVRACMKSNITYVDIAAEPSLVSFIKQKFDFSIPICVSGLEAGKLYNSVLAGADLIEVGNYSCLYSEGKIFHPLEILSVVKKIRDLLPNIYLTVTIPYIFDLEEQINLIHQLNIYKVDLIQTEGSESNLLTRDQVDSVKFLATSFQTIANTYELSKLIDVPIISSSGLSLMTACIPFMMGASGIGIGKAVTSLKSEHDMVNYISKVKKVISKFYNNVEFSLTSTM
uniref:Uncharacterized protein ycf23 n=1 Tax=Cyanidium sp. THAL103 TaxID=3027999 RepID=A0A9Y1MXW7_9RHOD|nr:hypothetical protein CspTHAL103_102 [Cyanidium sp. THAL103]